jgi:hypothetical protein
MDPISAALTNAWLEAVIRLRAPATDVPPRIGPPTTMTDYFENALRIDGAKNPGQRVDLLV